MIWSYNLQLTAIAPISQSKNSDNVGSLTKTMTFGALNRSLNQAVSKLKLSL